jgi:hypothetical protein
MAAKLKIESYKKIDFSQGSKIDEYTVAFNPDKFSHDFKIAYDKQQAIGSSGTDSRYFKTLPERIRFSLLFDSTIELEENKGKDVNTEINNFKDVVFTYNGDIHRPNYLKLTWGNFFFKGQVESMQLTYTAFSAEGDPQRAYADVTFLQTKEQATRLSEENKSSPDLTHLYSVKEGDTITMIADKIYGDPRYYLDIVRINKLKNFRVLKPGSQLVLPPLNK